MPTDSFVVDASLLHELGERLIGRPAIALGELVKNAFDADATRCRIEFGPDRIVVSDDGLGMSVEDFRSRWLRIGTTHKVDQRVSERFKRAFTGSKGIGRLSAQFLASELVIDSTPWRGGEKSVTASIDWNTAIRGNILSTVAVEWRSPSGVQVYAGKSHFGTQITLLRLKSEWDSSALEDLGSDLWMLRSPFKDQNAAPRPDADGFVIDLHAPSISGAREAFDRALHAVFSNWKARVRGNLRNGRTGGKAIVTVDFRSDYPKGSLEDRNFQIVVDLPVRAERPTVKTSLLDQITFEILLFKTTGIQSGGISVADLRDYLWKFGNVSMYDAGFRLPYYGSKRDKVGEDWLSIAADQGRRLNQSELLPESLKSQNKYMQDLPSPGRIFGAVDIDTNHERRVAQSFRAAERTSLEIQPGRDRLHDNEAFYQLRDFVRLALDFYANRFRVLSLDAAEKRTTSDRPSSKLNRALDVLEEQKESIPSQVFQAVRKELVEARRASESDEAAIDQRAALLAPLAAAGMAAISLTHELTRETRFLDTIGSRLRKIAEIHSIEELTGIAAEFDLAKRRLASLQELFAPLFSDADKTATDRLRVREVVDQVSEAMKILMPGVTIDRNRIPRDLRFPLGSLAEWNAVLQNLLSNAWNALLESSRRQIAFSGGRDAKGREWLRISDTGQGTGMALSETAVLFEPFERRLLINPDRRSVAIGGQGLGLAIVRMIVRRRSASIEFVEPEDDWSTTIQITWKGSK